MRHFRSQEEVAALCVTEGREYLIIENRVLCTAGFKHPGPQKLITKYIGKDATKAFFENNHSNFAHGLINQMTVGTIGCGEQQLLPSGLQSSLRDDCDIHAVLDTKIDVSKPLLPQVANLNNKEFIALIQRPRYVAGNDAITLHTDKDRDARAKRDYKDNVMILMPVIVLCLLIGLRAASSGADLLFNAILYFGGGLVLFWTFIEYGFHRFILHRELSLDPNVEADGEHNARIFSSHLHHHVFMNQKFRIAIDMDSYIKYGLPGVLLAHVLMLPGPRYFLTAGVLLGSLVYDWLHLAFHFDDMMPHLIRSSPWFKKMKNAHMRHHFRDNRTEFGVTSQLWDTLFGTL